MKAKSILPLVSLILVLLLLGACRGAAPAGDDCAGVAYRDSNRRCGPQTEVEAASDPAGEEQAPAAGAPAAGLPNPAAVYCEEQGYVYQIETAADGSQAGDCIFDEYGDSCDGWAYFRGECGPATTGEEAVAGDIQDGEPVAGWSGTLFANPPGAQFDDLFQRSDTSERYGIDSTDPALRAQLESLRDSGTTFRVWGILRHDVPDAYGMQIDVQRLEVGA